MYLTGNSYLDGGKLKLENKTVGTSAAGIYYKKVQVVMKLLIIQI